MKKSSTDILIIGAGISGLAIGYYLTQYNIPFKIVEARNRIGGRVYTKRLEKKASIELGATWIANEHFQLKEVLKELNLVLFEQELGDYAVYEPTSMSPAKVVQLPPNNAPSYRVFGGTDRLTEKLGSKIDGENILINQIVVTVTEEKDLLCVQTNKETFKCKELISTVPPHLFINSITFSPTLPSALLDVTNKTHTWMGESIKVGLTYKKPFWKAKGTSGTIFSSVGPIPEMYDHSNKEETLFALKGFFNGDYHSISREERLAMVLEQLEKYYGGVVHDYSSYEEKVWKQDEFTFEEYEDTVFPHQNNGNDLYQESYLNGKLFLAGSETSPSHAGYMEGAIVSAQLIVKKLIGER